jgi:hypothetical protein
VLIFPPTEISPLLKNATGIPVDFAHALTGAKLDQHRVYWVKDEKSRLRKNSTPNLAGESSHLPTVAGFIFPSDAKLGV